MKRYIITILALIIALFNGVIVKAEDSAVLMPILEVTNDESQLDGDLYSMLLDAYDTYNKHDYKQAELKYKNIIARYPNSYFAYGNLAALYIVMNDSENANKYIDKALSLTNQSSSIFTNKGIIDRKFNKDTQGAYENFSKAIYLDPNSYIAYNGLGTLFITKRTYQEAIKYFNKAISIKENYVSYYDRGITYALAGINDKAISDLNKAIKLGAKSPMVYYERGLVYDAQNKYKNAIKDFTYVIENGFINDSVYLFRGHNYEKLKLYENAVNDYSKAIELNENNHLAYFFRGSIRLNIYNDAQNGLDDLAKAEKLKKNKQ